MLTLDRGENPKIHVGNAFICYRFVVYVQWCVGHILFGIVPGSNQVDLISGTGIFLAP